MVNKSLIEKRFSQAVSTYREEAIAQQRIVFKMINLLQQHAGQYPDKVLEIGCGTGLFTREIINKIRPKSMIINDLCEVMRDQCHDLLNNDITFQLGDAEEIQFADNLNLIASCSCFQWFKNPKTFFNRCHSWLSQCGILAFSTFGRDNMTEIRQITGFGLKYMTVDELRDALSLKFEVLDIEEEKICLCFNSPQEVLYHLKNTGVTGISERSKSIWTRSDIIRFSDEYRSRFFLDDKVKLTYNPIYVVARKKYRYE